jgi:hypothetical protein
MDEHDHEDQDFPEIERRLLEFGSAPLPAGVAGRTLARVRGTSGRKLSGARLKLVSAAAIVGFAAGGVGLAAANVLPAPAQDVAHNALDAVGVHVPPGHVRYNDPTVCPGGPYANHGAYVRAHKDDPNAGKSPCGKPVQAVGASGTSKPSEPNDDANEKAGKGNGKSNGHGPPPWAHGNGKPDDKGSESGDSPTTKPGKPSSTSSPATTTAPSTASTTSTSASTSTSSTTSTTTQP